VWSLLGTASPLALLVYLTACATDLLDGKSARLLNSSSYNGTVLDASADFILVAAGFTYYVALGLVSPILLVVMSFSFLQYLLTVEIPIRDRLGKHVGTTLFFLLAVVMFYPTSLTLMVTSIIGVSYIVASLINRFQGIRAYRARICLLQTHPPDCVVSDY
jgi:phosphatidylglycerophosphate synthase